VAGYSGTPLIKKLGVKPDQILFIHSAPKSYYEWMAPLPPNVVVKQILKGEMDFIHLFATSQRGMKELLPKLRTHLKQNGMIWVSWPKKASGVTSDLDENVIRTFGLSIGLVDVKVCAIDKTWSGLKFVIPLKDRKTNSN
jgi:hypothetical protein